MVIPFISIVGVNHVFCTARLLCARAEGKKRSYSNKRVTGNLSPVLAWPRPEVRGGISNFAIGVLGAAVLIVRTGQQMRPKLQRLTRLWDSTVPSIKILFRQSCKGSESFFRLQIYGSSANWLEDLVSVFSTQLELADHNIFSLIPSRRVRTWYTIYATSSQTFEV